MCFKYKMRLGWILHSSSWEKKGSKGFNKIYSVPTINRELLCHAGGAPRHDKRHKFLSPPGT
jgi:hypothetical protein